MNTNSTELVLINDGVIKHDGGTVFGSVPKVVWDKLASADRRNRVSLALNCLLILNGERKILIDTGVGNKWTEGVKNHYGLGSSQLFKELRLRGLTPKDITDVVLTHLYFDHCGGSTRLDRSGTAVPTFPSATYHVQRAAWEEAINPNERVKSSYNTDDFLPVYQHGQMNLLDGDSEVVPGIKVRVAEGPSSGHQTVIVNYGGERLLFLGDAIPTPHHLELSYIAALDQFPEKTLATKKSLLDEAEQGGWLLVFSHGHENRAGYIENRNGDLSFRAVKI